MSEKIFVGSYEHLPEFIKQSPFIQIQKENGTISFPMKYYIEDNLILFIKKIYLKFLLIKI